MSEKKIKPKKLAPVLTLEQQAEALADAEKRREEARKREAELVIYSRRIDKMPHRQLQIELRKRARAGEGFLCGGLAAILSIVLENTKSAENPFAKVDAYPR